VGFQLFNYFARNADQALIGRIAGAAALGPYSLALRLVMQPLGSIGQVAQRVLLPVYARMQDDKERLRAAHLRVTGAVATIVFPFLALAIALAEPLVRGAFAERWGDVAPLVSLLGAVGFVQVLTSSTAVVYQALRRTDLMFFWGVGSGSAVVLAFWIGSQRGAVGVAFAYLLVSLALAYPGIRLPLALIDLRPSRLLRAVAFPAVLALSIAGLCRLADGALSASLPPLARFATLAAAGLAVYVVGIAALDRRHARDVAKLLRGQVE
jgi:PST family polysaccharide transporter